MFGWQRHAREARIARDLERIEEIREAIAAIPPGPVLTPDQLLEIYTREALDKISGAPHDPDPDESRPKWAASPGAPPWKEETA